MNCLDCETFQEEFEEAYKNEYTYYRCIHCGNVDKYKTKQAITDCSVCGFISEMESD